MDAFNQLENITRRMAERDYTMIDPVEFGEIKGAVSALQVQMSDLKARHAVTNAKLDLVLEKLSEAKGGWRVLMLLGGAASALGAGLTWLVTYFKS